MNTGMRTFIRAAVDLCFPSCCQICASPLNSRDDALQIQICDTCLPEIKKAGRPFCCVCGHTFKKAAGGDHFCGFCLKNKRSFKKARALVMYQTTLATLLQSFKYQGNTAPLAFFKYLHEQYFTELDLDVPGLIIPVPLHRRRLRQRGFNQALVLARTFFPDRRTCIDSASLVRVRHTAPQTGLSGTARRKNIHGAFEVAGNRCCGQTILLLDDVFTTGTTVDECAKVLLKAGALEVQVLTLARADF
jgi:ComF family protein